MILVLNKNIAIVERISDLSIRVFRILIKMNGAPVPYIPCIIPPLNKKLFEIIEGKLNSFPIRFLMENAMRKIEKIFKSKPELRTVIRYEPIKIPGNAKI